MNHLIQFHCNRQGLSSKFSISVYCCLTVIRLIFSFRRYFLKKETVSARRRDDILFPEIGPVLFSMKSKTSLLCIWKKELSLNSEVSENAECPAPLILNKLASPR